MLIHCALRWGQPTEEDMLGLAGHLNDARQVPLLTPEQVRADEVAQHDCTLMREPDLFVRVA